MQEKFAGLPCFFSLHDRFPAQTLPMNHIHPNDFLGGAAPEKGGGADFPAPLQSGVVEADAVLDGARDAQDGEHGPDGLHVVQVR